MLRAAYTRYILQFKIPSGTSRGILHDKETWFIKIWDDANPLVTVWENVLYFED